MKVPSDISDHDASIIFIECPKFQTRSFQREVWLYERTDNEKIASKLDTVDWNALLSDSQDVDEMCNTFTETFLRVTRECIPTKIVTIRNSDRPWFNSELRKRDRIRKTVKKYSKQSDIDKYKKQRNRVNNLKIEFLTCGNDNLTYEQNCIIFKYVFDYIKCSKRFLIV